VIDAERFFEPVKGGRSFPRTACVLGFDDDRRIHWS
jgi:hypothetical protein